MPVLSESQWRASVGKRVQCDKGVGKLMYFGITKNSKVRPTSALRPCSDPPKMTNFTSNHDCHPLPPPLPGDGTRGRKSCLAYHPSAKGTRGQCALGLSGRGKKSSESTYGFVRARTGQSQLGVIK